MENQLPSDFTGVFYFTNFTEEDFKAKWNSVEYTFPALKMTPLIIPGESPEGVQSIRKKFAKELAEREFYKSSKLKSLESATPIGSVGSFHNANVYSPNDLEAYVQQCLAPLPMAQAEVKVIPKKEIPLHTDNKGNPISKVVDPDTKLTEGTLA